MWLVLSLISALSDSSKNILAKKNSASMNSVVATWIWLFYSMAVLVPAAILLGKTGFPDKVFWTAFSIRIVLEVAALILYVTALKISNLSLSLPMLSFSPLFIIAISFVINGEFPKPLSLVGVASVVIGAYFLNFKKGERFYQPVLSVIRDKGSLMMLCVAFLWSFTSSLHKVAIEHSNPYFYSGLSAVVLTIIFTPLAFISSRKDFVKAIKIENISKLSATGILDGLAILSQMLAQGLTLTVLVVSIKRMSTVFSAIMGRIYFKEAIKNRIVPIIIMVLGVVLISIS